MSRLLHLVLPLLLVFAAANASASPDIFQEANKAYAEGKFEKAVKLYKEAQAEQGWSPGLLYNLGNAYAKLNRPGDAVLAYKRALYLRPWDGDAVANLGLTLKEAGIFLDEPSKIRALLTAVSMNRLAHAALAAGGILALYLVIAGVLPFIRLQTGSIKNKPAPLNLLLVTTCTLIILVAISGIVVQYRQLNEAVVLAGDTSLQVSPFQGAEHRTTIRPGRIVTIRREFQDYFFIEDANGQTGWLKKDSLERVVPGD